MFLDKNENKNIQINIYFLIIYLLFEFFALNAIIVYYNETREDKLWERCWLRESKIEEKK